MLFLTLLSIMQPLGRGAYTLFQLVKGAWLKSWGPLFKIKQNKIKFKERLSGVSPTSCVNVQKH